MSSPIIELKIWDCKCQTCSLNDEIRFEKTLPVEKDRLCYSRLQTHIFDLCVWQIALGKLQWNLKKWETNLASKTIKTILSKHFIRARNCESMFKFLSNVLNQCHVKLWYYLYSIVNWSTM